MSVINLIRSILFGVDNDIDVDNKYQIFLKKLGKHKVWFDSLNDQQKMCLFEDWELFKKVHRDNIKSGLNNIRSNPSFRKFIHFSKSKKTYFIPKNVLLDRLIDSLRN